MKLFISINQISVEVNVSVRKLLVLPHDHDHFEHVDILVLRINIPEIIKTQIDYKL